jgi:hypothetical protein
MGTPSKTSDDRFTGHLAIGGAATMVVGAVLTFSTGTDLWAALADNAMAECLVAIAAHKATLVANLSC